MSASAWHLRIAKHHLRTQACLSSGIPDELKSNARAANDDSTRPVAVSYPPSPVSSNLGYPSDQAPEDDEPVSSSLGDSGSGENTEVECCEFSSAPSSSGSDDGADLVGFVGEFSSSIQSLSTQTELDHSEEDTESDTGSAAFDDELYLAFHHPDASFGKECESSDETGSDSRLSSSATRVTPPSSASEESTPPPSSPSQAASIVDEFEAAYWGSDEDLRDLLRRVEDYPVISPPSSQISISYAGGSSIIGGARNAESITQDLRRDLAVFGFAFYRHNAPQAVQPRFISAKVVCQWIHDDTPGARGPRTHTATTSAILPNKHYRARLLLITGDVLLVQLRWRQLLMPPMWRWAHDLNLFNPVEQPDCPGCCSQHVQVTLPQ
ncbi:hypothetical protein OC861_006242 [Tilletia horrida]|nr:hypothetical protein OC861_006242 [Tilletia horrida]